MKDIHEVLRRKQAKYAQLAKQIEALRNDPDWRRERQDSMRAAMPAGPK